MAKAFLIIYSEALDGELRVRLIEMGLGKFTKFQKVQGVGTHSDPHLGDSIWPGFNNCLLVVLEEDQYKDLILARLKEFKNKNLKEGVKIFVLPVEDVV